MAAPEKVEPAKAEPYPADLQWMLEKAAYAEAPGRPCLMREVPRPGWVEDPDVRTRLREVRSDSYWLGSWARENLEDRLAYALVTYDFEPVVGEPLPASPPPLIYEIAVTGSSPVNAPKLRDRAAGVPVRIIYDVPVSFDQFMKRRETGGEAARELVDMLGEGGSPETNWAVRLMVFSEDGKPDPEALAHCETLRRAYGLPVLMEFFSARTTLQMGN